MATFQGFTCDQCETVLDAAARVRKTVKYEGQIKGQYALDLCEACANEDIPQQVDLKPLRTRTVKAASTEMPDPIS